MEICALYALRPGFADPNLAILESNIRHTIELKKSIIDAVNLYAARAPLAPFMYDNAVEHDDGRAAEVRRQLLTKETG